MASEEGNSSISPCFASTNVDSLPEELLWTILLLLPADFLHDRIRLVCSRWKRIVDSQAFVDTYVNHCSTYGLLLLSATRKVVYVSYAQGRIETRELNYGRTSNPNIKVCSGDGLAIELVVDSTRPFCNVRVINPATKQRFPIPPSPELLDRNIRAEYDYNCFGLAYCKAGSTKKYKLVLSCIDFSLGRYPHYQGLVILTIGVDKSWRKVEIGGDHVRFRWLLGYWSPVTTEGFLHWGCLRSGGVMTMNVETETFTKDTQPLIPLHPPPRDKTCHFLSTGKYLSLLRDCGYSWWEVWEMKPEEDSGEWRKMHACKIDLSPGDGDGDVKCRGRSKFGELIPLGWVKYLEILALVKNYCHRTCVFYNLVTQETDTVEIPKSYKGFAHRNNLAWLR